MNDTTPKNMNGFHRCTMKLLSTAMISIMLYLVLSDPSIFAPYSDIAEKLLRALLVISIFLLVVTVVSDPTTPVYLKAAVALAVPLAIGWLIASVLLTFSS